MYLIMLSIFGNMIFSTTISVFLLHLTYRNIIRSNQNEPLLCRRYVFVSVGSDSKFISV